MNTEGAKHEEMTEIVQRYRDVVGAAVYRGIGITEMSRLELECLLCEYCESQIGRYDPGHFSDD